MRNGILIIDGKVTLGPVKFSEAEVAYKARVRSGEAGVIEIWSSSASKRIKLKAPAAEPEQGNAKGTKGAKGAKDK